MAAYEDACIRLFENAGYKFEERSSGNHHLMFSHPGPPEGFKYTDSSGHNRERIEHPEALLKEAEKYRELWVERQLKREQERKAKEEKEEKKKKKNYDVGETSKQGKKKQK